MEKENLSYIIDQKEGIPDISFFPLIGSGSHGKIYHVKKEAIKILTSPDMSEEKALYLKDHIHTSSFLKPLRIVRDLSNQFCGYTSCFIEPIPDGFCQMTRQEFKEGFEEIEEGYLELSKEKILSSDSGIHNLIIGQKNKKLKPYLLDFDHYTYQDGKNKDAIALEDYLLGIDFLNQEEFRFLLLHTLYHHIIKDLPESKHDNVYRYLYAHYNRQNILKYILQDMKKNEDVFSFVEDVKRKTLS